jgi:hypothetical protein
MSNLWLDFDFELEYKKINTIKYSIDVSIYSNEFFNLKSMDLVLIYVFL